MLPHEVMDSAAYKALAPAARALLMELLRRFNGHNNGKVSLDQRTARDRLGVSPAKIVDLYDQLLAHGFLELSQEASRHERRAREWEFTWITSGGGPPYKMPSFAYRDWREGQPVMAVARNRKKRSTTTVVAAKFDPQPAPEKKSATTVVAEDAVLATAVVASAPETATTVVAGERQKARKSATSEKAVCYDSGSAYIIPSPRPKKSRRNSTVLTPENSADPVGRTSARSMASRWAGSAAQILDRFISEGGPVGERLNAMQRPEAIAAIEKQQSLFGRRGAGVEDV